MSAANNWSRTAARIAVACLSVVLPSCVPPLAPSRFYWTITPDQLTVRPGAPAVFTITIISKANINARVDLRLGEIPAGLTPSFTSLRMSETASTALVTIVAAPEIPVGTYTIRVTATEVGGGESTQSALLLVSDSQGPDISLDVDPVEFTLTETNVPTCTYYVRPLNGFSGSVSLSLAGLTPDLVLAHALTPPSVTIGGSSGGAGGNFLLRRSNVVTRAFVDLTVTATAGGLVRTRTIRVHLPAPANDPAECRAVVLTDAFNVDAGWTRTTEATPGFSDSVTLQTADGNPGGYRRMTHVLAGRGNIIVSHLFGTAYEPRTQGAISRIRYSEDRRQFDPPFAGAAVGSGFLVEQEGRPPLRVQLPEFRETSWQHLQVDLARSDLPGIDLSASGPPIRFGYYRANSDSTATVQHGIDNWRVEICR